VKWVRAFLWIVIFVGLTIVGGVLGQVSGIGVLVTRSVLPARYTSYQAYSTLANVDMVLSILFATVVVLAIYAIRRPGAIRARVQSFNERMRNPSVRDLIVLWVISPFTLYVPAIYATWHFYVARKASPVAASGATQLVARRGPPEAVSNATPLVARQARPAAVSGASPLIARLDELNSARQAGLISADEHETKRAQILQSF
jgi:hypothetical protein